MPSDLNFMKINDNLKYKDNKKDIIFSSDAITFSSAFDFAISK